MCMQLYTFNDETFMSHENRVNCNDPSAPLKIMIHICFCCNSQSVLVIFPSSELSKVRLLSLLYTPQPPRTSLSHNALNKIHKWLHKNVLICMIKQNAVYPWIRVLLLYVSVILLILNSTVTFQLYTAQHMRSNVWTHRL